MAVLGFCPNCKAFRTNSLTGKCKTCGVQVKANSLIDEKAWNAKPEEEKAAIIDRLVNGGEEPKEDAFESSITTCQIFEGRQIESYLGTVCGTDIYLVGGVMGGGMSNQEKLFGNAFKIAKSNMFKKAKALGANAVVGMQTVVTSPGSAANIIVVVTGTAVKLADLPGEQNQ